MLVCGGAIDVCIDSGRRLRHNTGDPKQVKLLVEAHVTVQRKQPCLQSAAGRFQPPTFSTAVA
jgi:hypothetical protein